MTGNNGVRNRFTYNADIQLTGPGTYVYDGNGNPTTWSGTSLTFDVENRMTAYGTSLTASYRGDGLRAWKNTASGKTYFLYDGISVVCELDAIGNVIAGSTYGAAGLLSRGSVQYQFDNLGDATIRLDGSGNVLSYRLFDAWGNEFSSGSDPYGYRARYGYYADTETGLIALAYRYYAPGVGRFLNRDPIGNRGGPNLFAYTGNAATARVDAAGLLDPLGGLAVVIVAGPVIVGVSAAETAIAVALSNQFEPRPGYDKKQHCFVCCAVTRWTGYTGGAAIYAGQILHEGGLEAAFDPEVGLFDTAACEHGITHAYQVWDTCETICDRLVYEECTWYQLHGN